MSTITVQTNIAAPLEKVWTMFTDVQHICQWYFAHESWHAPRAENDLRVGGTFNTRMEARDGSFGFDLKGVYNLVQEHEQINFSLEDGRAVAVSFVQDGNLCIVTETFEPENQNPTEMQQAGWQAILDNFKKHVENTTNP